MAQSVAQPLRMRVQFTKEGRARYLSHSEYSRTLMISARRAGLPLEYAGQNMSRMKVSLSPPLPIGITSECEYVDFNLTAYVPAAEAQRRLSEALPSGIRAIQCRLLGADARPVGKLIDTAVFRVDIPFDACSEGDWRGAVERFLEKSSVPYERVQPRRTRTVDLRSGVHGIGLEEGGRDAEGVRIVLTLDDGIAGTIKPWEVIEVLAGLAGVPREVWERAQVHRTGLFARRGDRLVSPMEMDKRKVPAGRGTGGGRY
jgi:radical SAM-linked protein